jgi:two-component system sensor histidine kinase ChiS
MNTGVILCVDDEEIVLRSLQRELNELLGQEYIIETAEGGDDALELFQELREDGYDVPVVISDHIMPGMKGDELLQNIHHLSPNTLNIMLTGQADLAAVTNAVNHADLYQYVAKPWETTHLAMTVKEALRRYTHERTIEQQHAHLQVANRDLERLNAAYERFVPREFLGCLQKQSIVDVQLGDQVQEEITILFADIRAFTTISEHMTPQENFDFLNAYLGRMGPIMRQHGGFIDKYIGDAVMAIFPKRADDALNAAIGMLKELSLFNRIHHKRPISIGIGLHIGHVILGTIGEEQRMETTVISDAVNLASRLEGLTKVYGTAIIISEQTLARVEHPEQYRTRFLGQAQLKGKLEHIEIFEVYEGDREPVKSLKLELKTAFDAGLRQYSNKDFVEAARAFHQVLKKNPNDMPARFFLERSAQLLFQDLPDQWDVLDIVDAE